MIRLSLPEPGQVAVVRQRRFVLTDVLQSNLSTPILSVTPHAVSKAVRQHLVNLTSTKDDALGETFQLVWTLRQAITEPTTRSYSFLLKDHHHRGQGEQDDKV